MFLNAPYRYMSVTNVTRGEVNMTRVDLPYMCTCNHDCRVYIIYKFNPTTYYNTSWFGFNNIFLFPNGNLNELFTN